MRKITLPMKTVTSPVKQRTMMMMMIPTKITTESLTMPWITRISMNWPRTFRPQCQYELFEISSMKIEFYLFNCIFQPPTVPRGDDYDEETITTNKVEGESIYREVTDSSETNTVAGSSSGVTVKQEPSLDSKNVMDVLITLNLQLCCISSL